MRSVRSPLEGHPRLDQKVSYLQGSFTEVRAKTSDWFLLLYEFLRELLWKLKELLWRACETHIQ